MTAEPSGKVSGEFDAILHPLWVRGLGVSMKGIEGVVGLISPASSSWVIFLAIKFGSSRAEARFLDRMSWGGPT